jgi:y4mF family transcriptional regulator
MMNITDFPKIIQYCRKESGLSQRALAQLAGVGKTVIFDIENGKQTVRFDSFIKVLIALNIKLVLEPPFPIELETSNDES